MRQCIWALVEVLQVLKKSRLADVDAVQAALRWTVSVEHLQVHGQWYRRYPSALLLHLSAMTQPGVWSTSCGLALGRWTTANGGEIRCSLPPSSKDGHVKTDATLQGATTAETKEGQPETGPQSGAWNKARSPGSHLPRMAICWLWVTDSGAWNQMGGFLPPRSYMVKILSLQLAWQWVLRWLAVQNKWTGRALRTLTVMVLQAFSESTKIYACIVLHSTPVVVAQFAVWWQWDFNLFICLFSRWSSHYLCSWNLKPDGTEHLTQARDCLEVSGGQARWNLPLSSQIHTAHPGKPSFGILRELAGHDRLWWAVCRCDVSILRGSDAFPLPRSCGGKKRVWRIESWYFNIPFKV